MYENSIRMMIYLRNLNKVFYLYKKLIIPMIVVQKKYKEKFNQT